MDVPPWHKAALEPCVAHTLVPSSTWLGLGLAATSRRYLKPQDMVQSPLCPCSWQGQPQTGSREQGWTDQEQRPDGLCTTCLSPRCIPVPQQVHACFLLASSPVEELCEYTAGGGGLCFCCTGEQSH